MGLMKKLNITIIHFIQEKNNGDPENNNRKNLHSVCEAFDRIFKVAEIECFFSFECIDVDFIEATNNEPIHFLDEGLGIKGKTFFGLMGFHPI